MKEEKTIRQIIDGAARWIEGYCDKSYIKNLIVGVSGGIDSAVITRLCEKTNRQVYCYSMPMGDINNWPESTTRAIELCTVNKGVELRPNIHFNTVSIGFIVEAYKKEQIGSTKLNEGNLRSRIRANILYDKAAEHNGIVVGTGNLDEDYIGYFTKGGDGLVDICPISAIHKSVVYEMAKILDVPDSIINAVPTAELWEGQTDEDELGMTYDEVKWAIDAPEGPLPEGMTERQKFVLQKVGNMHKKNKHKLQYPPIYNPYGEEDWSF
jgi:NAD+ synthase